MRGGNSEIYIDYKYAYRRGLGKIKPKVSQAFTKVVIYAHIMAVKKKLKDNRVPHSYKDAISRPDSHLWLNAM